MMVALVLGLYLAAMALGARYANHRDLSSTTRGKICLVFAVVTVLAFVFAGVTDTNWPVAVWYIISGLLTGIPIGDQLRGSREHRLEMAGVLATVPARRR